MTMSDDGWERRMSARAEVRNAARQGVLGRVEDREHAVRTAELDRLGVTYRAGMTLGDGVALLNVEPWACACVGPPHCCRYSFIQARALHRGAHIVAKLMTSAVEREQG